jgi:hypothetical protein
MVGVGMVGVGMVGVGMVGVGRRALVPGGCGIARARHRAGACRRVGRMLRAGEAALAPRWRSARRRAKALTNTHAPGTPYMRYA